jgi:hypothetical protein
MKEIDKLSNDTHFWAETLGGNIGVFKKTSYGIFIAENWEGSYDAFELTLIQVIEKPKNK